MFYYNYKTGNVTAFPEDEDYAMGGTEREALWKAESWIWDQMEQGAKVDPVSIHRWRTMLTNLYSR